MKKIMIAVAIVCAAAISQAATTSWGSGALYHAESANGGWGKVLLNAKDNQAVATMNVFLVDETTYNTVSKMDQAGIYEWAADQTATYTAQNKNASGTIIGAATVNATDLAASTKYYSIITIDYTDATYGDMFMATAKDFTTAGAGNTQVSQSIFGGAATATAGGVRDWQAVPEPTSGLLLLLGVAGLALRRRRA